VTKDTIFVFKGVCSFVEGIMIYILGALASTWLLRWIWVHPIVKWPI